MTTLFVTIMSGNGFAMSDHDRLRSENDLLVRVNDHLRSENDWAADAQRVVAARGADEQRDEGAVEAVRVLSAGAGGLGEADPTCLRVGEQAGAWVGR